MNFEVSNPNRIFLNCDSGDDISKLTEEIKSCHPFLLECPGFIDTISSQIQAKMSLSSIKSLIERASLGFESRLEENLQNLLFLYAEEPLYIACADFLRNHLHEILQLYANSQAQQADEKFIYFEQQYARTPLLPFLKEIKKIFEEYSSFSEQSLFQYIFEKSVYKIILKYLIKRDHKNTLHHSNGHCQGTVITLAAPLKGMRPAFIQMPYGLYHFFRLYFDKNSTSEFGEKFCKTQEDILKSILPTTYNAVKELVQINQVQNDYNKELIGRIAVGHMWGKPRVSNNSADKALDNEAAIIYSNFSDHQLYNSACLKIVGHYIAQHLSEFEEALPKSLDIKEFEIIGQWALNFYKDRANNTFMCWNILGAMFNDVSRITSLIPFMNRRGLAFVNIVHYNKPLRDLYVHLTELKPKETTSFTTEHYELVIKLSNETHVTYLRLKNSLFIFSDPNAYHPITFQSIIHSFSDINEYIAFIYIFISFWYPDAKTFKLNKYSEMQISTPQMKEYRFSQGLARRSFLLNEIDKLNNCNKLLQEKLKCAKTEDEINNINRKLLKTKENLNCMKDELQIFQPCYKTYIEEKISDYTKKYETTKNKSYELVIHSLKELLIPIQPVFDGS